MSLTAQKLDPLGGITARVLVTAAVGIAIVVAVTMSLATQNQISNEWLEVLGLLTLAAAGWYYIRATSPFRGPLSLRDHAIVCLLALAAVGLNAAAQWGSNIYIRDDWGPVAMAILTVTFGSYRPAREIVACTLITAFAIGTLAVAESHQLREDVPSAVIAIVAATPVLAAGTAATAFSRSLVATLLAWRAGVATAAVVAPPEDYAAAPRPSHREHLEDEVLPFLHGVAERSELTEADGTRARALAIELRSLMVIDAERSWMSRLAPRLSDPSHLADRMRTSEREFVRAFIAQLTRGNVFDASTLAVTLESEPRHATCTFEIVALAGRNPRVQLAPFVAVGRTVFDAVDWNLVGTALTFTLSFEPQVRGA